MSCHIITEQENGLTIAQWCKRHYPGLPHGLVHKLIRKKAISIKGRNITAKTPLYAGEILYVSDQLHDTDAPARPTHQPVISDAQATELRRMIIHETPYGYVLNKPSGLAVQGGSSIRDSIDARLSALDGNHGERPKLVHRLDKDTSGILLIGKDKYAATQLTDAFRHKDAQKTYWALVAGIPASPIGQIDVPLGKRYHQGKEKMSVVVDDEAGKDALTHYRIVETSHDERYSWVELCPITGRTHQLRVHMAAIGHPIIGDYKYGGRQADICFNHHKETRLHLHARALRLHKGDIALDVRAPLPPHMQGSWETLDFPTKDLGVSLWEIL
ncbi:MAG: RluA family pseudouridine synthase [Sphaerospermopsis sp. SIO1G2]|nr:RluA family pseudouridine synthase [Sphaerospermopsis sp. SIO1G2]